MFLKQKRLFLAVLMVLVCSAILNVGLASFNVFSYSASISASGTINIDVSASGNGANVTTDEITVESDCPLGYRVSISGPADSALYMDGDNTSAFKILASSGTQEAPASIITNKNTWGYATGSGVTINSNFIGLTDTAAELFSSSAASGTGGDKYNVSYGVSVNMDTPAGLYTLAESAAGAGDDKITYYVTADPSCDGGSGGSERYVIRYGIVDGVTSNTTMTGITHDVKLNDKVTLVAPNYKAFEKGPDGEEYEVRRFGFVGWSTEQVRNKEELTAAIAAGNVYGPNETIRVNSSMTDKAILENGQLVIKLYAVFLGSEESMENWAGCKRMNIGEIRMLTDAMRGNHIYAVAKLADGKCWMIENLRLESTFSGYIDGAQGYATSATYGDFVGLAEPERENFYDTTTANSIYYSGIQSGEAWIDIGTDGDAVYRFPRYRNDNTENAIADMTEIDQDVYGYSNYYTWPAALANMRYYDSPTSTDEEGKTSETVGTSICPAGWHLPYGRNTGNGALAGGFSYLDQQLGGTGADQSTEEASNRWRKFPNNFILSGEAYNNQIINRGNYGIYWTATASDQSSSQFAYTMQLEREGVNPGTSVHNKNGGISVRCIARDDVYTIIYNANGGTGTYEQDVLVGEEVWLGGDWVFNAPEGHSFLNWNTEPSGSGTTYDTWDPVSFPLAEGETITLYAQWGKDGIITYDDNGANSPTVMSEQTLQSNRSEIMLKASNFQRSGYGFTGWNTEANGTGTQYGPNEVISDPLLIEDIKNNNLTLYAQWVLAVDDLQNWTGCSGLSIGDVTALTDSRDGNAYAVAKLADGKCWMIENLRLNSTATINSTNTNNPKSGFALMPSSPDPERAYWCTERTSACINQAMNFAGNTDETVEMPGKRVYGYGNYYNWYAATAGKGDYSKTYGTTDGDICPIGWRLPVGGNTLNSNDFSVLNDKLNNAGKRFMDYPNNIVFAGDIYGYMFSVDEGARYATSSANSDTNYFSQINYNEWGGGYSTSFTRSTYKYAGYTVRCIKK